MARMEPRMRLKILSRSAIGNTYNEIADSLDISEYQVSKVINDTEDKASKSTPEDVLINEVVVGGVQTMMDE